MENIRFDEDLTGAVCIIVWICDIQRLYKEINLKINDWIHRYKERRYKQYIKHTGTFENWIELINFNIFNEN